MNEKTSAEKMTEKLKEEEEELQKEINSKIKKKKSFVEPETGNQFLK